MEPEGHLWSGTSARASDEVPRTLSFAKDPPAALLESGETSNRNDIVVPPETVPYETGRTTPMHTHWVNETEERLRKRLTFLCETPSYYDDDDDDGEDDSSSLSSHSVPELQKSYAFVESMTTQDDDDEFADFASDDRSINDSDSTVPVKMIHTIQWKHEKPAVQPTSLFSKYSLLLGFLIGCFIQSSALGANYVLTVLFGQDFDQIRDHHNMIMMFSLIWSIATSTMGALVVLFLRSLLQVVPNGSSEKTVNLWTVEYSFAFGALSGVCIAWCGTDVLLGFRAHAVHSLLTLIFAFVAKMLLSCMARNTSREDRLMLDKEENLGMAETSISQPLLEHPPPAKPTWQMLHSHFKVYGTFLGLIIGFYIQMSSLGASFLLDTFTGHVRAADLESEGLVAFSLGWSFLFGTIGVVILLVLRRLLLSACGPISDNLANRLGLLLEFYFAVGSLVGINLAWVLTYCGLGLHSQVACSLLTLGGAIVWCRIMACAFFSSRVLQADEEADDEYVVFAETPRQEPLEAYEAVLLV